MEKVCFQQFTETFPATLNFRNCIFPAYHRKGSHFRYEPGIFQKNLIWAQSRVHISSSCKATQICNCTSLVAVVGILRSCWQRGMAIPQCSSVNFETWFYQVNFKWFQNNFRGISDIVLGSSLRNMSTIERPQHFWAAALLAWPAVRPPVGLHPKISKILQGLFGTRASRAEKIWINYKIVIRVC